MRTCAIGVLLLAACSGGGDPAGNYALDGDPALGSFGPGPRASETARVWQEPRMLADGVYRLEVAGDDAGTVTALWSRVEQPDAGLWTSTYREGTGWAAPALLTPSEEIGFIRAAADRAGGATAVWTSWDGSVHELFAARRDRAGEWGAIERLDVDDATGVRDAAVAVTRDGDAVAVWAVANYPAYDLMARRYDVGVGWSEPVRVTAGPTHALTASVTIDDYGIATAMWADEGALVSARWEPGSAWSAPFDVGFAPDPERAQLAVDAHGAVTAVWSADCVRAARLEPFDGWSEPVCISDGAPWPNRVRIDQARGTIRAAWTQSLPMGAAAYTAFFDGARWDHPTALELDGVEYQDPDVGLDGAGGSVAVWSQHDPATATGFVRARRFAPGTALAVVDDVAEQTGFPQETRVAVAASGAAQALWTLMRPTGDLHWSLWTATYH